MNDLTKLKKIYEDYSSLKIFFEAFEHNVRAYMRFSKLKTDNEKKVSITYAQQGNTPEFHVNIPSSVIVNVLERYLESQIPAKELENWAGTLLMDNDHFTIASDEPEIRRDPALDALHQIASFLDSLSRQDIAGYISSMQQK